MSSHWQTDRQTKLTVAYCYFVRNVLQQLIVRTENQSLVVHHGAWLLCRVSCVICKLNIALIIFVLFVEWFAMWAVTCVVFISMLVCSLHCPYQQWPVNALPLYNYTIINVVNSSKRDSVCRYLTLTPFLWKPIKKRCNSFQIFVNAIAQLIKRWPSGWTEGVRLPAGSRFFSTPQRSNRLWSPHSLHCGLFSLG
jgi:hypothetical protein